MERTFDLTLLITTRGRKTDVLRRTALIYSMDGEPYLLENPKVELQVGAEKFSAKAKVASSKEKPRLWKIMSKIFPTYDKYQAKAEREIPLIILKRTAR